MRIFKNPTGRSSALFFWGTFILFCGIGFLISRYGLYNFENILLGSVLGLLLIIVGISCLKIPTWLKKVMVGLRGVVAAILVLAIFASIHNDYGISIRADQNNDDHNYNSNAGSSVSVSPSMLLDTYKLKINASKAILDIEPEFSSLIRFNSTTGYPYSRLGNGEITAGKLFLYPAKADSILSGKLKLSKNTSWDIGLYAQEASLNADLSNIRLSAFHISSDQLNGSITFGQDVGNCDVLIECSQHSENFSLTIPKYTYCEIVSNDITSGTYLPFFKEISPGFYKSTTGDSLKGKYNITLTGQYQNLSIHRQYIAN